MTIAVLATAQTKQEILEKGVNDETNIIWADSVSSLVMIEADAYFDFQFGMDKERTEKLTRILPKPLFINAVVSTVKTIGDNRFIRINGWPGMIKRPLIEFACADLSTDRAKEVFGALGWESRRVEDIVGLISPRILVMIINEAYFTLEEGVSTKEDIDVAMQLGTNYPYGPFEWAQRIGLQNVVSLLTLLHESNGRYQPSRKLLQDADSYSNQ
jgi:3-hydroxybutyryl-CoA dehydrogenase